MSIASQQEAIKQLIALMEQGLNFVCFYVFLLFDLRVHSCFEVSESSLVLDFAADDRLKATFKVWICTILISIKFSVDEFGFFLKLSKLESVLYL